MRIIYEFPVTALCPNEPHPRNHYQVRVESEKLIWAEVLQAWADEQANRAVAQEALTEALALRLPGATVTITGRHGAVCITSIAHIDG